MGMKKPMQAEEARKDRQEKKPMDIGYALRGNRTPGGSMATTQVTTTPLMLIRSNGKQVNM